MTDILRRTRLVNRVIFDPANPAHVESFKTFLATNTWGDTQFYPEAPFTEAPATVMTKYARHVLNVVVETANERDERLVARNVLTSAPIVETKEAYAARLANANALIKANLSALAP